MCVCRGGKLARGEGKVLLWEEEEKEEKEAEGGGRMASEPSLGAGEKVGVGSDVMPGGAEEAAAAAEAAREDAG